MPVVHRIPTVYRRTHVGLGDLFKGLLGGSADRVDYSQIPDDELLRLAESRGSLTIGSRQALEQELDRRSLKPATQTSEAAEDEEEVPAIEGDPVLVIERRGVVLRTQAHASLLVMMPIWDAAAPYSIERPEMRSNVTEILLLNQLPEGFLPSAYAAERLTIGNRFIYALDAERPADRGLPAVEIDRVVVPEQMEAELEIGHLKLSRTRFLDVVIASWDSSDLVIALGPRIPAQVFREHEGITHVIGGLVPPQTEEERAIYADPDLYRGLDTVILLLDCAGVTDWPATLLPDIGVTVQVVGRQEGSEQEDELAVKMKLAIDAGAWDEASALLEELSAREIEDVVDALTIERNVEAARRVLGMALASEDWKESGRIVFLDGVTRFIGGDVDGAVDAYRRAAKGEEPEPRAWTNLSAILRRRREHAEAIACAEAAVEAMPEDAIALVNLVAALASAGKVGEARATVDRYQDLLGSAAAMEWHARLESWPPFESGPDEFPHLADKACQLGRIYASNGQIEQATDLLRRALELQPSHVEAVLELGVLLSAAGRDPEALELYDAVLATAPGISFVRFNRASCLARMERVGEAIEELERVAREVPEWDAPREVIEALGGGGA